MSMEFKDFPQCVKGVILSEESIEANKKIIADFNLSEEQIGVLFELLRKVTSQEVPLELVPEALKEKLGFDEGKAKKAAIQIAGLRFLVLSDWLKTNVDALIKKWGGETEKFQEQTRRRYELRKKLDEEIKPQQPKAILSEELTVEEKKAEMLARVVGLTFEDENFQKRFRNIIVSCVNGIRTEEQVKELLGRLPKIGGMGYDEETINKVIMALQEVESAKMKEVSLPSSPLPTKEGKGELFPERPRQNGGVEGLPKEKEPLVVKYKPLTPLEPPEKELEIEAPTSVPLGGTAEGRPKIVNHLPDPVKEIKKESFDSPRQGGVRSGTKLFPEHVEGLPFEEKEGLKLFGPVDEIRELKLIDFKRLDSNPQKAAEKIKQKVDLLEKDSVLKKIEGIKAWRESEVYRTYIQIGYESLLKNKLPREIIEDRQRENKPTLSVDEFYAVADLNMKLRF